MPSIGPGFKTCDRVGCPNRIHPSKDFCNDHNYLAPTIGFKGEPVTHYEGTIAEFTECIVEDCTSPQEYGFPYCKKHNRKCEIPTCPNTAIESLRYCQYHMEENAVYVESEPTYKLSSLTPFGKFSEDVFQICLEVKDILQKKNQDYGNSAHEQFLEYGQMSYNLRIEDKLRRLKQLAKNPAQVEESIEETILDLIGYGVLYLKSVREVNKIGRKQSTAPVSS